MDADKEIRWVGSAYADLMAFPKEARKEAGFQLGKLQAGLDPSDWKPFEDVGPGTRRSASRKQWHLPRALRGQVRGGDLRFAFLSEEDSDDQKA